MSTLCCCLGGKKGRKEGGRQGMWLEYIYSTNICKGLRFHNVKCSSNNCNWLGSCSFQLLCRHFLTTKFRTFFVLDCKCASRNNYSLTIHDWLDKLFLLKACASCLLTKHENKKMRNQIVNWNFFFCKTHERVYEFWRLLN